MLLSMARTIGLLLQVDPMPLNKDYCMYARVQVEIDLQYSLPPKILGEGKNHSFEVSVSYENLPDFCTHYITIGHFVGDCRALKRVQDEASKANLQKEPPQKNNQRKHHVYVPKNKSNLAKEVNAGRSNILTALNEHVVTLTSTYPTTLMISTHKTLMQTRS